MNYPANHATLDDKEMKSTIYWEMRVRNMCIGMKHENKTKWLQIKLNDTSLHSLFTSNIYFGTNLGKSSWETLLIGSSLRDTCINEGINVVSGKSNYQIKIRIGILGGTNTCNAPTSFIGFGSSIMTTSGNVILREREMISSGYILVK
jgi:hypothetical protein